MDNSVFKTASLDGIKGKYGNTYDFDDYKIFLENGKLFIEAGSDYAANHAVIKLIAYIKQHGFVPAGFVMEGKYTQNEYSLSSGYAYRFGDEFTGTTLDKSKWSVETKSLDGTYYLSTDPYYTASRASLIDSDPNNDFGGPWTYVRANGKNYYQEGKIENIDSEGDNYQVKDGVLEMKTYKTDTGYNATKISATNVFRYGIMEARIKVGTKNGAAAAFWARSRDDNGASVNEFDFFENFGKDQLRPNMHTWTNYTEDANHAGEITYRRVLTPDADEHFYDAYHHIALEWSPTSVRFYLDGNLYLSQDITEEKWDAFRKSTYLIFSISAPSGHYAEYAKGQTPGEWLMENIGSFCESQTVDFVRIYQQSYMS